MFEPNPSISLDNIMADDTTSTHRDGCKQSQLSEPEVAHDDIEVVIVDHDAIEAATHNDCVAEERPAAAEPLETKHNKILRFPSNLRRIGTERDYIAPRTVALGPYYHGVPELQAMEVIKRRAVDYFFERLAAPREEIYKEFIPIARAARSCYVDASAFAGITDDEFFSMMFVDAIFLVQFIGTLGSDPRLDSMVSPYLVDIMRDMLLLENQIPWLVTHFFMALWPLSLDAMICFLMVSMTGSFTFLELEPLAVEVLGESYMPSHLLCLMRTYRAGCSGHRPIVDPKRLSGRKSTTSAAELSQMGIRLRAGEMTAKFSDMDLVRGRFFADLSLLPLYLDSNSACWLVNMAALETYTENFMTGGDCSITSYLSFVATLMNREQDVRELRARGIVDGFTDRQTLNFFEGLCPYLTPGHAYFRTILAIHEYTLDRWLWIAVYRFLYNNSKIIATVLPIVSVLVGILKTLLSLKQH